VVNRPEGEDDKEADYVTQHVAPQIEQLIGKLFGHEVFRYLGHLDAQYQQGYSDSKDGVAKENDAI
jgi:hypothetical protein